MFTLDFLINMEKEIKAERDLIAQKITERNKEELEKTTNLSKASIEVASSLGKDALTKIKKFQKFLESESFPSNFQIFSVAEFHSNCGEISSHNLNVWHIFTTFEEAYDYALNELKKWQEMVEKIGLKFLVEEDNDLEKDRVDFSITGYGFSNLSGCMSKDIYKIQSHLFSLNPKNTYITSKLNRCTGQEEYSVYEL